MLLPHLPSLPDPQMKALKEVEGVFKGGLVAALNLGVLKGFCWAFVSFVFRYVIGTSFSLFGESSSVNLSIPDK